MKRFKTGDIISMDFNPTKGHEQAGRRPAVIVNNYDYGRFMDLAIVCPVSNTRNKFPTHVTLDERTKTTGSVLCQHVRTVDLSERNAKFIEALPEDIFQEVQDIVISFFI